MAYTDTSYMPLHMPTPGTREPAAISLLNQNCVVIAAHDHSTGKGIPVSVLRSGIASSRPAASLAGQVYFATDSGLMSVDNGTAWVDFMTTTGQVNLTDPIIRDTLQFGAKPNGAVDYTVTRVSATGLQFSGNVGVGVAPAAWRSGLSVIQVRAASLRSEGVNAHLAYNTVETTTNGYTSIVNDVAIQAKLHNAGFQIDTAPPVGVGAAQTFTTRLQVAPTGSTRIDVITSATEPLVLARSDAANYLAYVGIERAGVGKWHLGTGPGDEFIVYSGDMSKSRVMLHPGGQVTITADSGQSSLALTSAATPTLWYHLVSASDYQIVQSGVGPRTAIGTNGTLTISPNGGAPAIKQSTTLILASDQHVQLNLGTGMFLLPGADNAFGCGHPTLRWNVVYAVAPAINTSHVSLKEHFSPLDPAACVDAVLGTDWLSFDYKQSAPDAGPPAASPVPPEETPEATAARKAQDATNLRLYEDGKKGADIARHQKGYVLGSPDYRTADLFGQADRFSASTHADLAVVACALQSALERIAALEAKSATA